MSIGKEAKLNHLSFPTTNVAETAAFFEQYLGCEIVAVGDSCLLKRNGFDIVLDHVTEEVPVWPKNFHFGLELDSLDDVHTLYKEFLDGGVRMETEVFNNSRGSRFFLPFAWWRPDRGQHSRRYAQAGTMAKAVLKRDANGVRNIGFHQVGFNTVALAHRCHRVSVSPTASPASSPSLRAPRAVGLTVKSSRRTAAGTDRPLKAAVSAMVWLNLRSHGAKPKTQFLWSCRRRFPEPTRN
jgi:catechol 2,3-dioxygenase-like lactoylglutathione lyase family enzyme